MFLWEKKQHTTTKTVLFAQKYRWQKNNQNKALKNVMLL